MRAWLQRYRAAPCMPCPPIGGKHSSRPRPRSLCGRILRLWRAMSGYVGSPQERKPRRGTYGSRKGSQNSKGACAARAAGPGALIGDTLDAYDKRKLSRRRDRRDTLHNLYPVASSSDEIADRGNVSSPQCVDHRALGFCIQIKSSCGGRTRFDSVSPRASKGKGWREASLFLCLLPVSVLYPYP